VHIKIAAALTIKGSVYPPISEKKEPIAVPSILPIPNPNYKYPNIVYYVSLNKAGTIE